MRRVGGTVGTGGGGCGHGTGVGRGTCGGTQTDHAVLRIGARLNEATRAAPTADEPEHENRAGTNPARMLIAC